MVQFIKRLVIFLLVALVFVELVSFVLLKTNMYLEDYPGNEIYNAIFKSKKKCKAKILILGDSVGEQLFSNKENNDSINSLTCNQAIGVCGHYFLLRNYCLAGNKINHVYLIYTPFSFKNNLDEKYTFHYFLKPFNNDEYNKLFSASVFSQVNKIPYRQFINFPHILISSWSPKYIEEENTEYSFLSPISGEYLNKIKMLAEEYGFKFTIVPPPTRKDKKRIVEQMDVHEADLYGLTNEFEAYFNRVKYIDQDNFKDETHLKRPLDHKHLFFKQMLVTSLFTPLSDKKSDISPEKKQGRTIKPTRQASRNSSD